MRKTAVNFTKSMGKRLNLERLEDRLAPANDLFGVNAIAGDAAGAPAQVRFEWSSSKAGFKNEIGAYVVDDANGTVAGLSPSDPNYAAAALARSQVIFASGSSQGAKTTRPFQQGQLIGLYLVSNGTTAQAIAGQRQVFFTFDAPNRDGVDHALGVRRGDGGIDFRFEDMPGGGDLDYNDAVISLTRTQALLTPGQPGQSVVANFTKVSANAGFKNEVGLVRVDAADGAIGNLRPGDAGYVRAALGDASRRLTLFSDHTLPGVNNRTVQLGAGTFYATYVVSNGTADQAATFNPDNTATGRPSTYFSFSSANFDGLDHLEWRAGNEIGFEDLPGLGDADFDDMIVRYTFEAPQGTPTTPPPPPTAVPTISDVADQTINEDSNLVVVPFTVGDDVTPVDNLTVTATSSNQALAPDANLVLGGSGANRTVTITPAPNQNGTAIITLTVSDGTLTATDTFTLTVRPVNDPPSFTASNPPTAPFNAGTQVQTVPGFATFNPGAPNETDQTATYTVGNVSNPMLFSTQPSVAPNGTLTYTPVAGGFGSSTFNVTVSDGSATSATQTFTITVDPVQGATNNLPFTLNDAGWQVIPTLISDANPALGTVADGTRILDVVVGNGATVARGNQVTVFYRGYLLDGTVFDQRQPPSAPVQFLAASGVTGGVIPGFAAGLVGMQVGGTRRIDMASYLAYGGSPPPGIPVNARLVFEVMLVSIP